MSDFHAKDVNAYEIKNNTLKAFLPLVLNEDNSNGRILDDKIKITAIAEINACFYSDLSCDSSVMIKNMKISKIYYYDRFCDTGIYAGKPSEGFIRRIQSAMVVNQEFYLFNDTKPSIYELYNTLFSDKKEAEQNIFGGNKEFVLSLSSDDFNTFSDELLDTNLYLPFTYYYLYSGVAKRDGYIVYRPCSNAHMHEFKHFELTNNFKGWKNNIIADKVVPIGFIECPINICVRHRIEYYKQLSRGEIQRIPEFGKPICFDFGLRFDTETVLKNESHNINPRIITDKDHLHDV